MRRVCRAFFYIVTFALVIPIVQKIISIPFLQSIASLRGARRPRGGRTSDALRQGGGRRVGVKA